MADSARKDSRKTSLVVGALTVLVILVVGGIISVRGCHQPNSMEDRIDPDDQLPGTLEGTGSLHSPDAAPLLRAA
jgi:hypothetical protein